MLVLSRKLNESIVINGNIRITVTSVRGQCVRLGIEAPEEVGIYREELFAEKDSPVTASSPIRGIPDNEVRRTLRPAAVQQMQSTGRVRHGEISFRI